MIIQVRGTSGSGKSTIVKTILDMFPHKKPLYKSGRKQPLGQVCFNRGQPNLFIPGHYNTACGGCDNVGSYDEIYRLVRKYAASGHNVLYEGLLISGEVQRAVLTAAEFPSQFKVVILNTPLEECLDSINIRRQVKKPDAPPVNPKTTTQKFRAIQSAQKRLEESGISCVNLNRQEALRCLVEWLSVKESNPSSEQLENATAST